MLQTNPKNFEELYIELNNEFYSKYDVEYFQRKSILSCSFIAKRAEYESLLSSGFKVGKIEIGASNDSPMDWIDEYAKREIVINSYHSIESFFRLLFAHLEKPECPWLGLIEIKSPHDFKGRVEDLMNHKYFKSHHEDALTSILLGSKEAFPTLSSNEWSNNQKQMLDLIERIGRDLLNTPDYNVFKHGGALFSTSFGINFADVIKNEEQESFVYLSSQAFKEEHKITTKYSHTVKFMKWEIRAANTMLVTLLLENLVNLSQMRLGIKDKVNIRSFHTLDLHKMLETGIITDTVSELMFETSVARKPKKK